MCVELASERDGADLIPKVIEPPHGAVPGLGQHLLRGVVVGGQLRVVVLADEVHEAKLLGRENAVEAGLVVVLWRRGSGEAANGRESDARVGV